MKLDSPALDIYIKYPGLCEEAFTFYEEKLGARIESMMYQPKNHGGFPSDWKNPVLHAVLSLGGITVRGADIPHAEPMRSAYLTLRLKTEQDAEAVYELLAKDGQLMMKMEKTFFANRFAQLRDRFGTSWMLLQGL